MENFNLIDDELFNENEKRCTYRLAVIVIGFTFLVMAALLLDFSGVIYSYTNLDKYLMVATSITNIIVGLIPFIFPKTYKAIKYLLLFVLLVNVGLLNYAFSYLAIGFFLVPIIVATRFYDRRLTLGVIICSFMTLFIVAFVQWGVAKSGADLTAYHFIQIEYSDLSTILSGPTFYQVLSLITPAIVCYYITSSGRKMIADQADISTKVGSLKSEIKTASLIQDQVLPKNFNMLEEKGLSIYASMKPAKETGGDFYDFFMVKNKAYFLVGDVSDKGLYAAMFMMNIKNIIQSIAQNTNSLEEIITTANNLVCKGNDNLMFVTIWIACIDLETKKSYYVNAGHSNAYIKKSNGELILLNNEPQTFIGAFPNYIYKKEELDLCEGDMIYLYTDGVTDALNNDDEPFGAERLEAILKSDANTPKTMCDSIRNEIKGFAAGREAFDDITMLALSINKFDYEQEFEANYESLEIAQTQIRNDLIKANVEIDTINLINTAMDDLLDNIVSYASTKENKAKFKIQYTISNDLFRIIVSDSGTPFNPLKVNEPDLSADRKIGGLGIHIIKNIMDSVEYSGENNKNVLILSKKIGRAQE